MSGQEPEDLLAIKERIIAARLGDESSAKVNPFKAQVSVDRPRKDPFIASMKAFYGLG